MKNTLRFDHDARCIVMDRTFYKNSSNIRFEEYAMLQRARQDYPTYTPVIKRIKRNPNKETYTLLIFKNSISDKKGQPGELSRLSALKKHIQKMLQGCFILVPRSAKVVQRLLQVH